MQPKSQCDQNNLDISQMAIECARFEEDGSLRDRVTKPLKDYLRPLRRVAA